MTSRCVIRSSVYRMAVENEGSLVRTDRTRGGRGPGFFPNRFGVCRPRFVGGYRYGLPYGYGYGYGRGYYGGGYRRYGY